MSLHDVFEISSLTHVREICFFTFGDTSDGEHCVNEDERIPRERVL